MQVYIQGCPVHYEQCGEGTPILCIHGFPEDHRALLGCLEPVFETMDGYRRIYIDLPGMGESPANPSIKNADGMLEMLRLFIERVIGDECFLLLGQSYGGYLSLGLTGLLSKSILGLFLLCPCVRADRSSRTLPKKPLLQHEAVSLAPGDDPAEYDEFLDMAVVATKATWERYRRDILPGLRCADALFTQSYQQNGYALSSEPKFQNTIFEKPAAFLLARQDNCVGYEDALQLMGCFPRASFLVIDGAGHNLQIEKPDALRSGLNGWLESCAAMQGEAIFPKQ